MNINNNFKNIEKNTSAQEIWLKSALKKNVKIEKKVSRSIPDISPKLTLVFSVVNYLVQAMLGSIHNICERHCGS